MPEFLIARTFRLKATQTADIFLAECARCNNYTTGQTGQRTFVSTTRYVTLRSALYAHSRVVRHIGVRRGCCLHVLPPGSFIRLPDSKPARESFVLQVETNETKMSIKHGYGTGHPSI